MKGEGSKWDNFESPFDVRLTLEKEAFNFHVASLLLESLEVGSQTPGGSVFSSSAVLSSSLSAGKLLA